MRRLRGLVALAAVLAAAVLMTACDTEEDGRAATAGLTMTPELTDLADTDWVANEIVDPDRDLVAGTAVEMTFTATSLSARAGCNTMNGSATIDGTELVVGALASTMMACEDPLAEQDAWLSGFLTSKPVIAWDGEEVWLTHDQTTLHLAPRD